MSRRTQRAPSLPCMVTAAPTCPCGKAYYPTKAAARDAYQYTHPGDTPHRYYQCPAGGWHFTRQVTRPTTR